MVLFDNIRLIKEIQKRPPLYNMELKEYNDPLIKRMMWEEVYVSLFPNTWDNLTAEEKAITGRDVQLRWKNIRTCFTRELKAQRSLKLGHISHKRRKYMYFDKLLFLLPSTKPRSYTDTIPVKDKKSTLSSDEHTTSAIFIQECEAELERQEEPVLMSLAVSEQPKRSEEPVLQSFTVHEEPRRPEETVLQSFTVREEPNQTRPEKSVFKSFTVSDKTATECDAETHFVLSLVPFLKSLSPENKLIAQIEILQVFKKIEERQRQPSSNSETFCPQST